MYRGLGFVAPIRVKTTRARSVTGAATQVPENACRFCNAQYFVLGALRLLPATCTALRALLRNCLIKPFVNLLELRIRTSPTEFIDILKQLDVRPQRRKPPKQQGKIQVAKQRGRKGTDPRRIDMPLQVIPRNRLDMSILRQNGGSGLCSPTAQPRISIG